MGLTKMTGRFYDDKLLWETYMGWGRAATYARLREWCLQNGMYNPITGKVSQMGCFWAMWRYAVHNPEEAYEAYRKWQFEYGLFPTFEDFCKDVYAHAFERRAMVTGKKNKAVFYAKYIAR